MPKKKLRKFINETVLRTGEWQCLIEFVPFKYRTSNSSGGMSWTSDHSLVSAVSNAGGLGIIGAGAMLANLREEIDKHVDLLIAHLV